MGEIGIDGVVLANTTLLALGGGLLTGLVAAVSGTRQDLSRMLGEAGQRASEGKAPRRLRQQLTVLEIALAMVLVTCAGLVAKSFWQLTSVNPGFRTDHVLSFNLTPPPGR